VVGETEQKKKIINRKYLSCDVDKQLIRP